MAAKKSDDSSLQDAASAQKRRDSGSVSPSDELDSLTEELQGSVAEAKAVGADDTRLRKMEKNFEALLGIVEEIKKGQISMSAAQLSAPNTGLVQAPSISSKMRCQQCGQYMSVCSGKHVRMHIMPINSENVRFFQGVSWNGVRYYGASVIPEACMHDIAATVRTWEFGERILQHGRNKVVQDGASKTGLFIIEDAVA